MAAIEPAEIERGLVARYDPELLAELGASSDPAGPAAVRGVHYFVCIARCTGTSVWVPAFSRPRDGRIELGWKGGEPEWVQMPSYIDLIQQWIVPDAAIGASSAGYERTRRGARNRASWFFLLGRHLDRERDDPSMVPGVAW
jgi:hypothetical protein